MLEQIEIFAPGRHVATNGKTYEFTADQVAAIAADYSPATFAAPIVIGHPKMDDPAYGWAELLTVNEAGKLVAKLEKVNPAFAEGVDGGSYRKVSAKFYEPADPNNPKPGSWYLRHIGFLGATPPAVKGLAPAFAEESDGPEFADQELGWLASNIADGFRRLRDWFIGKYGVEEADKAIPAWTDESATRVAQAVAVENAIQSGGEVIAAMFSERDLADRVAALDARELAIAEREAAAQNETATFAEGQLQTRRGEDATYVASLVEAGRLPPGYQAKVLALFAHAGGDTGGPSFAEGQDARP